MSNVTLGPSAELGLQIYQGSNVYFSKINKQGGINNRKVKIIALNDGYEPLNTIKNTKKFILQDKVFALFGYVGTPTSFSILPLIEKSDIPYLMPFTGAEFLRNHKNVYNYRPSYYNEASEQINFLVNKKNITKIGLLIQADEFGLSVEQGLLKALSDYNLQPIITTRFQRNTKDIEKALYKLKSKDVEAVALVGTYKPLSNLINLAHENNFKPYFTSVSFVSSSTLFDSINTPNNVLVTEVLPNPKKCKRPICQQFNLDMKNAGYRETSQIQFEGYLNAYLFHKAANECHSFLTRNCLLTSLRAFDLNKLGFEINKSKTSANHLKTIYFSFQ